MAEHHGKPSGENKSESATGIPSKLDPASEKLNEQSTDKYTNDDDRIKENIQVAHPNRNTGKDEDKEADYDKS